MFILVYVDNIKVTESSSSPIPSLIRDLGTHFAMKDRGLLHYFLGIEVPKLGSSFHLSQAKYVRNLIRRLHLCGLKPISTPAIVKSKKSKHSGSPLLDPSIYHTTVGALQYLIFT